KAPASDASTATVASANGEATSAPMASARPKPPPVVPATASSALPVGDGGVASCKVAGGPTPQPFNGPAILRMAAPAGGEVAELVYNEGGSPRIYDARIGDAGPRGPTPAKSPIPACAAAGEFFFCPDASGAIHQSRGPGEEDVVVARSKPGTEIAAGLLA